MPHTCLFRVYYGDTDAGGVMYHAAYIDFFARARNEWCRDFGLGIERQKELRLCFIIHEIQAIYHRPARLEDLVNISTEVISLSRIKIIFHQKLYRNQELLCEATITAICVDISSLEVKRLPTSEMVSLEKRLSDLTTPG
jgi:acyl-CoA thioester hydrolase